MGSMTIFSEGEDGRGLEHGITFPFDPADQGVMMHVCIIRILFVANAHYNTDRA